MSDSERRCVTCGVDISDRHQFSRYCALHSQAESGKKVSPRQAIASKCRDCIYDPLDAGNWRQQVHACIATDCPLWPHRPKSSKPLTEQLPALSQLRQGEHNGSAS